MSRKSTLTLVAVICLVAFVLEARPAKASSGVDFDKARRVAASVTVDGPDPIFVSLSIDHVGFFGYGPTASMIQFFMIIVDDPEPVLTRVLNIVDGPDPS